ncbi:MAG: GNAT family N-acetyltransferase [Vulcanibacillus sp.]
MKFTSQSTNYFLKEVLPVDSIIINQLYEWELKEKYKEYFTCRPINPLLEYEDYFNLLKDRIEKKVITIYVLKSKLNPNTIYGKINMFDYNSRNLSAEFGYYIPEQFRGKGLGRNMVELFLDYMFNESILKIHKLYATTSSANSSSIKLLEGLGFNLDGRLRDHYWIGEEIYDQLHYSLLKKEWKGY